MAVQHVPLPGQPVDLSDQLPGTRPPRPVGPGRKPRFREEDVVREAFRLGLDRFTLTGIAEKLGVVTSALYRLFPSRGMVVDVCLQRVFADWRLPDPGAGWQEALRMWASEWWRHLDGHRGLAAVACDADRTAGLLSDIWDSYTRALLSSGKTPGQVVFAVRLIVDTVVGAAQRIDGGDGAWDGMPPDDWRWDVLRVDGIPVEDLWSQVPDLAERIDVLIGGLERYWPEASTSKP